jgi:hypothetical protein
VISDVYKAQDAMRAHTMKATTVIALATQLHTIATGNMTPSGSFATGWFAPSIFTRWISLNSPWANCGIGQPQRQ